MNCRAASADGQQSLTQPALAELQKNINLPFGFSSTNAKLFDNQAFSLAKAIRNDFLIIWAKALFLPFLKVRPVKPDGNS